MSDLMNYGRTILGSTTGTTAFKYPTHRLYDKYRQDWVRVRDAVEGQRAVKAKGTAYLPRLSGQGDDDYKAYKYRAVFFGITGRLLSTNVGVIVRRAPTLKYSKDMEPYFKNDDISTISFNENRRELTRELSMMGRVAILVDVVNDRPVLKITPTEPIINWVEDDDGVVQSILLASEVITTDPITFTDKLEVRYFNLHIDDNGYYAISDLNEVGQAINTINPSVRGKKLKHIPFYCINPFGVSIHPAKPPIIDIADINFSHYLSSADLENGRHFVGLPTPWVTGASANTTLRVGCETAWVIPNKDAKVGYLEFLGQGLGSLEKALQEKQSQMSQFSAQLMDTSTKGSEAEGTVRLRYSSDAANLTDIALSTETCLNLAYGTVAEWQNFEKPSIELNKDFLSTKMSHNELTALTKSLVDGAITPEIFMYNLERGELTPNKQTL